MQIQSRLRLDDQSVNHKSKLIQSALLLPNDSPHVLNVINSMDFVQALHLLHVQQKKTLLPSNCTCNWLTTITPPLNQVKYLDYFLKHSFWQESAGTQKRFHSLAVSNHVWQRCIWYQCGDPHQVCLGRGQKSQRNRRAYNSSQLHVHSHQSHFHCCQKSRHCQSVSTS